MIETRCLKNVVIFVQTILSFVLSRKSIDFVGHLTKWLVIHTYFSDWHGSTSQLNELWVKSSVTETLFDLLCISELCLPVSLCLPICQHHHLICLMENIPQTQASGEHKINCNRMVKLCNLLRVCHQCYCMEMLTNIYLEYGKVGYLIMSLLSGHRSMV